MEKIGSKSLFYLSLCIVLYFSFLFANAYIIKSDNIIIGYIQNTITIPMLLTQLILFIISVKHCIRDKFKLREYSFWAFVILFISNIVTLGSIILK